MKNSIDIATLNIIYKKYKEHIIYLGIITVCFLIFIFITIPNVSRIEVVKQERKAEEEKLKVLSNNMIILQNTDNNLLESQLQTVSGALPESKDFEGILNAISLASGKSGASVNDYSFGVGALSDQTTTATGYPYIQLALSIRASQTQAIAFLKNISETVPLSQITSVTETSGNASIDMLFYYKSSPSEDLSRMSALNRLSQKNIDLISTISTWNTSLINTAPEDSTSNNSTTPAPSSSSFPF